MNSMILCSTYNYRSLKCLRDLPLITIDRQTDRLELNPCGNSQAKLFTIYTAFEKNLFKICKYYSSIVKSLHWYNTLWFTDIKFRKFAQKSVKCRNLQCLVTKILPTPVTSVKVFIVLTWGQFHKNYFGVNLLTLFCKLDHFINVTNICCIAIKRSSFKKRVSKFTPKKFYVNYPCVCLSLC